MDKSSKREKNETIEYIFPIENIETIETIKKNQNDLEMVNLNKLFDEIKVKILFIVINKQKY